jgi:hypothetical protein
MYQDGIRAYFDGNPNRPLPFFPGPDIGEIDTEEEDQGNKAFNYGAEYTSSSTASPSQGGVGGSCRAGETWPCPHLPEWLGNPNPSTPVWNVTEGAKLAICVIGANDKPRAHSYTLHGHTWPTYEDENPGVWSGSLGRINPGSYRITNQKVSGPGDWAYRTSAVHSGVKQGLWGIVRATAPSQKTPKV